MPRTRSPFNLGAVLALCQLEIPFCRFKLSFRVVNDLHRKLCEVKNIVTYFP